MSVSTETMMAAPPPVARQEMSSERKIGIALLGLWALAAAGLLIYLISVWNPELLIKYAPKYLSGLWITIKLTFVSIVLGAILSVPLCYARMSKNPFLSAIAYGYVYFFRGTPLLAQTFLFCYALAPLTKSIGLWWIFKEQWNCAVLAFALNTAAYQAEILRGAILSVPRGQWEGSASLGLHKVQTLWRIILPQAMVVALRPYGNEIILMIKGSAIVTLVTIMDLMGQTRLAYANTFEFQAYIWAGFIYLAIVETLRNAIEWIERRITKHMRR
jgi:polar amino acid transport system permease protein